MNYFSKSPQSCPFQFVEGGNYFYNCKPWDSTSQADLPAGGVWTNSERSLKQFGFLRQIRDRSWKVMLAELTRLTWPTIVLGGEAKRREIANTQICHQLTTRMRHWQLHCPHLHPTPSPPPTLNPLKRG